VDAATSGAIVSKGQFAALRDVSPGRVSQWISEGKLGYVPQFLGTISGLFEDVPIRTTGCLD
jgi:hypothetical protein